MNTRLDPNPTCMPGRRISILRQIVHVRIVKIDYSDLYACLAEKTNTGNH